MVRDPATSDLAALVARLPHGVRPLTRLSYFFDAQLFGLRAAGFLATSLALHLVTVLLVLALARRRLDSTAAFCAALVFSLQPANAEVIAYASARSTGLTTPLLLAGLLLHDRGRRLGALACFTLACLAKEVALVFPALVWLWDATRGEPEQRRGAPRELAAAALLALALGALLLSSSRYRALLDFSLALRPLLDNLLANGRAVPVMLSLWLRPWALSPDHGFAADERASASLAGLLALASALAAAFALRRMRPLVALALAWPLVALLPTNSLLPKLDLVTERPLYLAWVGPSLALGAGLRASWNAAAAPSVRRALLAAGAALLVAALAACIWRTSLWRDPVQLWRDAVAKAPNKSRCWNNLGIAELGAGHEAEALRAFRRAVRLDPRNGLAQSNVRLAELLCGPACASDGSSERAAGE